MKKVIEGKIYNTETATFICEDSYSYQSDFRHWSEELYQTPKGKFFLVGEGGPMSKYAESIGNGNVTGSGDNCVPLTDDEALEWCEKAGVEADKIQKLFPTKITEA